MNHLKIGVAGVVGFVLACSASAVPVNFSFMQTDAVTGSGSINAFTYDDGGGAINFAATPMPAATVVNPATGQYVGQQTVAAGAGNDVGTAVGLVWNGSVTATGTRGANTYTMQIPLKFIAKQTQSPSDVSDYTWSLTYGDSVANDAISTSMRFAMWLNRDDVADAADTPNTYQRYTQQNHTFVAGLDTFNNNDAITTAIKDATDSGDPQGTDAAGRNLAFYFGWRDQGALSQGAILIDTFQVGGLLDADAATLTQISVPEPSSLLGVAGVALLGVRRRRRPA